MRRLQHAQPAVRLPLCLHAGLSRLRRRHRRLRRPRHGPALQLPRIQTPRQRRRVRSASLTVCIPATLVPMGLVRALGRRRRRVGDRRTPGGSGDGAPGLPGHHRRGAAAVPHREHGSRGAFGVRSLFILHDRAPVRPELDGHLQAGPAAGAAAGAGRGRVQRRGLCGARDVHGRRHLPEHVVAALSGRAGLRQGLLRQWTAAGRADADRPGRERHGRRDRRRAGRLQCDVRARRLEREWKWDGGLERRVCLGPWPGPQPLSVRLAAPVAAVD